MTKERFRYQNLRVYEDMIRAISLGIDKMTAKLASVWKKEEEHAE